MRYLYLIEGLVFVMVASLVSHVGGFPAIIGTSILCSICFSGLYGIKRINSYFEFHFPELERRWLVVVLRIAAVMIVPATALWLIGRMLPPVTRLVLCGTVLGLLGIFLFFRYGITGELRGDLVRHTPRSFQPVLAALLGASNQPRPSDVG